MATDPGFATLPPFTDTSEQANSNAVLSLSELKRAIVTEESYTLLKKHFLMSGRGRRPDLPPVSKLTNMLLLQLHFLKEEGNNTVANLKTWLSKLIPDTVTVSDSRITKRIQVLLNGCTLTLLHEEYDFHALSPPLAALGLSRLHLSGDLQFEPTTPLTLTNEAVQALEHFRSREGMPQTFVKKWLDILSPPCPYSEKQLKTRIKNLIMKVKACSKKKDENLSEFLSKPFYEIVTVTAVSTDSLNDSVSKCSCSMEVKKLKQDKCRLVNELSKTNEVLAERLVTIEALTETIKDKLETDKKLIAEVKVLKDNNCQLELEKNILELENKAIKIEKEVLDKQKFYKINSDLRKRVDFYKRRLANQNQELSCLHEKLTKTVECSEELKCNLNILQKKIDSERVMKSRFKRKYENEKDLSHHMQNVLNDENEKENEFHLRHKGKGRRFCDNIRLTYINLQCQANVSAENCKTVVQIVANHMFEKKFKDEELPKATSATTFQDEAHVIAKEHALHEIRTCNHYTYGTDGTSRQKKHFLEQHVTLDNGKTLSLGFTSVASDDSDTLLDKTVQVFEELCDHSEDDKDTVMKEVIAKMKCIMSDRASVMKCFDQKMSKYKDELLGGEDCSTHFLFCNAHFLLGMSSAVEEATKVIEDEMSSISKLGRDAQAQFGRFQTSTETAAIRLIRTSAEVFGPRGDEKSGCRQEWLAFCSEKNIKSWFTSFRSNRFNNLFQNSSALIYHEKHILEFLNDYCSHSNLKLQSIEADLKDARITSTICAISLLHVFFTEPYWQLMNSQKSYGDFPQYARMMEERLSEWVSENELDVLNLTPIFEDFDVVSSHLSSFLESPDCDVELIKKCFVDLVRHCNVVFCRQLSDFLQGGVFGGDIPDEILAILKTCPLTNLTGERLFGDLDFDIHRRRNASLHLHSSKIMWKRNQTSRWVKSLNQRVKKKLIAKAIRQAPSLRKKSKENEKSVQQKIKEKMIENKKRKLDKQVNAGERKAAVLDKILDQGGLCCSKDDVDNLLTKPNALDNLKAQINYRRLCKGEKIQVTGTLDVLYRRLLRHLGETVDDTVTAPVKKRKVKKTD